MTDFLEQLYFLEKEKGNSGFEDVIDLLSNWDNAPLNNCEDAPLQRCGYCQRPFCLWGDREFCSDRCQQNHESLARACANVQRAMRSPVARRFPTEDDENQIDEEEEWTDEESHLFTGYYVMGPDGRRRPCFAID